jgi:hypothetical protein
METMTQRLDLVSFLLICPPHSGLLCVRSGGNASLVHVQLQSNTVHPHSFSFVLVATYPFRQTRSHPFATVCFRLRPLASAHLRLHPPRSLDACYACACVFRIVNSRKVDITTTKASSSLIIPHRPSSCLIMPHHASSCLILPHPASSCLILPHHPSSCLSDASSCLILPQ